MIKPGNGSTCPKCGKGHPRDKLCPAHEAVCHKCKKRGHLQVMCQATAKVAGIQEETADVFLGALADSNIDKWTVSLKLFNIPVQFQIDTGRC